MKNQKNILVVTGSVRPNSANRHVVRNVLSVFEEFDHVAVRVADLAELNLPYYDATTSPSDQNFDPRHESVRNWAELVRHSDAVVLVVPEYNRSMSAVQKNAIDWLYDEWRGKPVGVVAYGFHQGRRAVAEFEAMNANLGAKFIEPAALLQYGFELDVDGSVALQERFRDSVTRTLSALIEAA